MSLKLSQKSQVTFETLRIAERDQTVVLSTPFQSNFFFTQDPVSHLWEITPGGGCTPKIVQRF